MSEDVLALLEMIGLRPVLVDDLNYEAWMVPAAEVVLFRTGLSTDRLEVLVAEVLAAAVAELRATV